MTTKIKGILFDFGGTLYEYYPPNAVIWSRIAKRMGVDISPDDPRIWTGMKNQENAYVKRDKPFSKLTREELHLLNRNVLEAMGIKSEGTFNIIHEEFEKRRDGYKIYPDCKNTLEKIQLMGIKIGLLSNCDELHAKSRRPTMKEREILHFFDTIILSYEVGYDKPQKKIFELALNAIGIQDSSKVIHVGDNLLADVMGAKNAGLIPVLYDPHDFYSEDNLIKIKTLSEILNYLN